MTTSNDEHGPEVWNGRLTPSDVHHVLFTRAGLGRRGYDEIEVDVFLERVQQELTRLIGEKADLRDEVSRLKSQVSQAGAAPRADGALSTDEANLQAVRLLAAAQQTADVYVADAEKYSQRLTLDAREHSEAMLDEARKAAQRMVAEAERLARTQASRTIDGEVVGTSQPSQEELEQQVAYLKTFGQVVRVQLRSYLEALLRDVEEEWGRADPAVLAGPAPTAVPASSSAPPVAVVPPEQAADEGQQEHDDEDADDGPSDAASHGPRAVRQNGRATVSLHSRSR